jgi:hypothetical protein
LLSDVGYALDLERCVRCGRECPPGKPARVDPARGGLVCASCGGARLVWSAELRAKAIAARASLTPQPPLPRGERGSENTGHPSPFMGEGPGVRVARDDHARSRAITTDDAEEILAVVDAAMAAHAGFDR